jgi:deoxyribose-phosphate aldolase
MTNGPTLISEATVARVREGGVLRVCKPYLVTPMAAELAAKKKIQIVEAVNETKDTPGGSGAPQLAVGFIRSGGPPLAVGKSGPITDTLPYDLAGRIESTLLAVDATPTQIEALCDEAVRLGFVAVCVNPIYLPLVVERIAGRGVRVVTVCGFPLGANATEIKAAEARLAEAQGANEIDMVIPIGYVKAGRLKEVKQDIESVRHVLHSPATVLKVIIEAPRLTDEEKVAACVVAIEAGADYVKTGTGFSGPATAEDVALLKRIAAGRVKIKAAGGIRDRRTALALIAAGADRIGTSHAAALVGQEPRLWRGAPDE